MSITSERIRENCFIHHLMDAAADDIEALEQEVVTLTRQRDLAVDALKQIKYSDAIVAAGIAQEALSAIKESEEN